MVLKATVQLVKEKGAKKIYVGDSPALQNKKFKPTTSRLSQICEEEGVEWVDFSISISKFKTHQMMYMTGPMKNMFGLVPSISKSAQHMRHPSRGSFAKMICGVLSHAKVGYTIMDAVMGMEGPGPANGTPRKVGKIIAGNDPVAVEIAQATIMRYVFQMQYLFDVITLSE